MDRAGVELIGVKGLGYEWLGTAERATAFGVASERDTPAGIVLSRRLSRAPREW